MLVSPPGLIEGIGQRTGDVQGTGARWSEDHPDGSATVQVTGSVWRWAHQTGRDTFTSSASASPASETFAFEIRLGSWAASQGPL